jgi:adenine-specific DNA-methyltransferase
MDINGNPIEGDYITTAYTTKTTDRRYFQINFFSNDPTLKQKKALVSFINKQKAVKLPSISEDANFLLAEDDDACNTSILFDVTAIDDWKDALEGHDEITDFYIVTQKDSLFRQIKTEISELMGPIEESVPVTIPMKDGFKANAIYFKLGFLDKTSVALGRQFKELLPILWMKAGARGECPTIDGEILPKMLICEKNHFAVLIDENVYTQFEKKMNETNGIDVVYIITDSDSGYKEMAQGLHVETTYQLYRDYLDNFRINNVR